MIAPTSMTILTHPIPGMPEKASLRLASAGSLSNGMSPVSTSVTPEYSAAQRSRDAMMPNGRVLLGWMASSAVLQTASKPMKAKKQI